MISGRRIILRVRIFSYVAIIIIICNCPSTTVMFFRSRLNLFYIFTTSLLLISEIVGKTITPCNQITDCQNSKTTARCSFCVNGPSNAICVFPFPIKYNDKLDFSCQVKNTCDPKCVKNNSFCFHGTIYTPRCICKIGFHGSFCDKRDPEGFEVVKGVQTKDVVLFPGENTETNLYLYAFDVATIEQSYFSIQTNPSNGLLLTFSCKKCDNECKDVFVTGQVGYRWHRLQLKGPYKKFNIGDKSFLFLKDHIYGYMLSVNAAVYTGHTLVNHDWNIFVSYTGNNQQSLECIALIQLNNCGASPEKEVVYKRYSDILITRSVQYLEDGQKISTSVPKPECADDAKLAWKLWIMSSKSNHTFEYLIQPDMENRVNKTLMFLPFSLQIGKYKLFHEVRHVGDHGTSHNYQYCYFSVKTTPLVALVDGGSSRRILKEHGLILVSRSSDPNSPPTQQDHLQIRWICEGGRGHLEGKIRTNNEYIVSPEILEYGADYKCTLTVWTDKYGDDVSPELAIITVTVAPENKTSTENETTLAVMPTELRCVQNCGELVIPNRVLILRMQYDTQGDSTDYVWTYRKEGGVEEPTDSIEQKVDTKSMLIVAEDKLEPGVKYIIKVTDRNTGLMAEYSFITDSLIYTGNCTVVPESGIKGIDLFSIICSVSETEQYRYEFYDKFEQEVASGDIFNGRMLGTTRTGSISDVRLTRGHVMVYVYDEYGLCITRSPSVSLTELIMDNARKTIIDNELKDTLRMGDRLAILGYISFIPDILPENEDKTPMANTLLDAFKSIELSKDLGDVKQWLSTMANVLLSLNKPNPLALEPEKVGAVMVDISLQAGVLANSFLGGRDASKWMSPKEVRTLSTSVLNCVLAGIISKDDDYVGADDENTDLQTLEQLREGSKYAESTLDKLKDVMSFVQSPGQPPSKIVSSEDKISLWAMQHDHDYSVKKMLDKDEEIPIDFSIAFVSDLEGRIRSNEKLTMQVGSLEENLFWWDKTQIDSTLTSVTLSRQTSGLEIHKITQVTTPMNVTVRLAQNSHKNLTCSGMVRVNPTADWDALDHSVQIHRLDLEPRSIIDVEFHFPPTNGSIRVTQSTIVRPDYDMMVHNSMIVNESNPRLSDFYEGSEKFFLYLGVLPGPDIPANQTVEYSFIVKTRVCQLWARDAWTSEGCMISTELKGADKVHCMCQHFSIFAAAFLVPPQQIDPFGDTKLFLTVLDNPLVVAFVSSILVAFILLCLIMSCLDRRDERLTRVVVLGDNFPSDSHPYLLAVYTSSRFNAGSTAHVGFRVYGKLDESRAHLFTASNRKVLRRGTDDWFVMYCSESLGEIKSIHLWHDNFGSSPDWFVVKILVFDLAERTEYRFVVEQWLALRTDCFPEANVLMAKARDLRSVKHTFLENFILGLREGHLLLAMVLRHPRSEISRVQRISLFMVWMMVAMLCSIMFYQPPGSTSEVDSEEYTVGMRELIVSVQCVVISVIITFIVLVLFKLSYKTLASKREKRDTLKYRDSDEGMTVFYPEELRQKNNSSPYFDPPDQSEKRKDSKSLYKNFVRIVSKTMKTRLLLPVRAPHSPPIVKTRKLVYAVAWIVCLTVIAVCAYLVMLYGLKMGAVDSKKWLSSVLMSLGEEVTVAGPLRLLVMALLLSLAYKKMFEVTTHKITASEALELRPSNDDDYFRNLLVRRCHPMYAPLSEHQRKTMLSVQQTRNNYRTLCDFTMSLAFVVVLHQLVFSIWTSHFHATDVVHRTVTSPIAFFSNTAKVNLRDVRDTGQFEKYLKETFIDAIYKLKWYDGVTKLSSDEIDGKYWASGNVNRMVGGPQIRQLRTVPRRCETLVGDAGLCATHWSSNTADEDAYGEEWRVATVQDMNTPNSPWRFSEGHASTFATWQRLYASSGRIYDRSGYLTSLTTADRQSAEGVLGRLETFNWQNYLTRAAFLEFTLYNVNTDMLSQVTIIVEYLISGETLPLSRVTTVEGNFHFNVWYFLFAIFTVYYCALLSYSVNRQGLLDYLRKFNGKCSFLLVILGLSSALIALLHYYVSSSFIREYRRKGKEEYFDFDSFYAYFRHLQTVLSLLLAVAIIRMISLLRLGRPILSHFYTLVITWRWMVWLTIVAILLFFVLHSVAKLMRIALPHGIQNIVVLRSSIPCENCAWNCLTVYFLGAKLIMYSILMGMFIIIFMYYYKIAKVYKPKPTDDFNFLTFINGRLKKLCCRK